MRKCNFCGEFKPLTDYTEKRRTRCRACHAAYIREWRSRDPQRIRDANRWLREHPEEARRASTEASRRARARDPERARDYDRRYRVANRARIRQVARDGARRRYAENPEPVKARARIGHRRRRVRYDAAATLYAEVLAGDPCAYCDSPGPTIDHIDPVARSGGNDWTNLTAACGTCNASKGARPLLLYMLREPLPRG